jgi:hypothetical protein
VSGRCAHREKALAKGLWWAGWIYSFANKRKVYGLQVVLLWCDGDGGFRIVVCGFPVVGPQRLVGSGRLPHQAQGMAQIMLKEVLGSGLKAGYIVFDTHYSAGWFTKKNLTCLPPKNMDATGPTIFVRFSTLSSTSSRAAASGACSLATSLDGFPSTTTSEPGTSTVPGSGSTELSANALGFAWEGILSPAPGWWILRVGQEHRGGRRR